MTTAGPVDLTGLTLPEIQALLERWGEPPYRAAQLARWIYRRAATSWAEMTDLPAALRARLAGQCRLVVLHPVSVVSADGGDTLKYLLALPDGAAVETVFMRYRDGRRSVCVSTQVGCGMGCTFCATGLAGLIRNLTAGEIVDQVLAVQRLTGERPTHVVFMGMGEPLANYDATLRAVRVLNAPWGVGIGMRRMTVSTVGLVPQIRRLAAERLQLTLAVSLHAPTDDLRASLVPITRRWPVAELLDASRDYVAATGRRVTFEYVLLEGVNDHPAQAATLADLLRSRAAGLRASGEDVAQGFPVGRSEGPPGPRGWPFHVNLIPWNPVPDLPYRRPPRARVAAFARTLRRRGVPVTVRLERGVDIEAACGQLRRTRPVPPAPVGAEVSR
ncbi:MAG: 23S rRNA (adenine(2503)-C(2))-methyltransferase RlmN [Armatimonadota bacterium]|nr:23S rRNA (adenine(2503)-C(2))-methyltransferase RlmN [Armatimonadota bacterium]MDR7517363.1 23S rRNA (adenine(2503)-C(2))-methyltransferase RlmN [Armatimonadota bacterium]MDR7561237.1 23S rRNA (adenine(2503)-C(2))-methyltransferase RlmN [Armatimonadota bacterium]MDR7588122.1 23S rRNA (adenine(2503)-C(2))-methyltransferase RlmN [Armatimonadota bacterium]MDR7611310.1 23S rRNA (adenine(2503)-C(2))-methyltransferase RlmN [Armatimonadota bacterium]